jgi:hypothetical protein
MPAAHDQAPTPLVAFVGQLSQVRVDSASSAAANIRRAPFRTTSSSSETSSRRDPFSATTARTGRTLPTDAPTSALLET